MGHNKSLNCRLCNLKVRQMDKKQPFEIMASNWSIMSVWMKPKPSWIPMRTDRLYFFLKVIWRSPLADKRMTLLKNGDSSSYLRTVNRGQTRPCEFLWETAKFIVHFLEWREQMLSTTKRRLEGPFLVLVDGEWRSGVLPAPAQNETKKKLFDTYYNGRRANTYAAVGFIRISNFQWVGFVVFTF